MKLASAALVLAIMGVLVFMLTQEQKSSTPISTVPSETSPAVEANRDLALDSARADSPERSEALPVTEPAPMSPARTLRIVVRSQTGRGSNTRDVSGIPFEVGTGQKTEFPENAFLQATTNAQGRHQTDLELPELAARAQIFVRPLAPGFTRKLVWARIPENAAELEIVLQMEEGCTIRGLVLNSEGDPVPETRVLFQGEHEQLYMPRGWFARSDSKGRFELHDRFESQGVIRAQKHGVGNALLLGFNFRQACQQRDKLVLQLQGSGVLAGRATDPNGRAIVDFVLEARLFGKEDVYTPNETEHSGQGFISEHAITGERGEFRFEGLQPGAYRFLMRNPNSLWTRISEDPFQTGNEDIELIARPHRLELTILKHDGTPAERVDWFQSNGQSEFPSILCFWKRDADLNPLWKGMLPSSHPDQTQLFGVEAGWTLRFAGFSLSGRTDYQEVTFGETDWVIERTIKLPPPREPGTLELSLETSDGRPFTSLEVTLRDSTGTLVHQSQVSGSQSSSLAMPTVELTADNYDLIARVASSDGYGFARASFELKPTEHLSLTLIAERGGRLELSVTAEQPPRDSKLAALYAESTTWNGAHIWPNVVGASLEDVNAPHPNLSLKNLNYSEEHDAEWIPIGCTGAVDHALSPGDHLIRVNYPGYAPALIPVTIEVGKTTKATVELVPI